MHLILTAADKSDVGNNVNRMKTVPISVSNLRKRGIAVSLSSLMEWAVTRLAK